MKNNSNIKYKVEGVRYNAQPLLQPGSQFLVACFLVLVSFISGCGLYKFNEATIPQDIKTVKVNFIENKARYINPQMSPKLTDKLRQKVIGQTRLSQTNSDTADWDISGYITDYSFSTSAISGQQVVNNRLTVAVHIILIDRRKDEKKEHDISTNIEFPSSQTFQQVENARTDEIIKNLTDEIFNRLFSNW